MLAACATKEVDGSFEELLQKTKARVSAILCVQLLLQAGAHVNRRNNYGRNVFQLLYSPYRTRKPSNMDDIVKLLIIAGEKLEGTTLRLTPDGSVVDTKLDGDTMDGSIKELCLKHKCRNVTRKNMIDASPVNLFHRVPQLGLPSMLSEYLLYNVSLDTKYEDEDPVELFVNHLWDNEFMIKAHSLGLVTITNN